MFMNNILKILEFVDCMRQIIIKYLFVGYGESIKVNIEQIDRQKTKQIDLIDVSAELMEICQ